MHRQTHRAPLAGARNARNAKLEKCRCTQTWHHLLLVQKKLWCRKLNCALHGANGTISHSTIYITRILWAPSTCWKPFGPLDFVFRALRALKPCDTGGVPWAWRRSSSRTRTGILWGWDESCMYAWFMYSWYLYTWCVYASCMYAECMYAGCRYLWGMHLCLKWGRTNRRKAECQKWGLKNERTSGQKAEF